MALGESKMVDVVW